MEIWKDVKGYEGIYQISSLGRLKVKLKFRKYRDYNEKILNPTKDKDGYLRTALTKDNKKQMKTIHRLVAETFLENNLNYPVVNHINGIKDDNRVENLEWCSVLQNNLHAIKLGFKKSPNGEKHHMCKISSKEVLEIKENKDNLFQRQLAVKYNISQTQISRILNNKRWNKI
jgi:hypothetical protein